MNRFWLGVLLGPFLWAGAIAIPLLAFAFIAEAWSRWRERRIFTRLGWTQLGPHRWQAPSDWFAKLTWNGAVGLSVDGQPVRRYDSLEDLTGSPKP